MRGESPLPHNRWDLLGDPDPAGREVSVVVAHYRQPDQLARTLRALEGQTLAPREVVVADDGSEVPPRAAPSTVPIRVVAQPDLGFRAAAVRNLGARHCGGEILVFLDADTTPEPGCLDRLTRRVAANRDVLAVGRRHHAALAGLPLDADPADAPRLEDPGWLAEGYRATNDLLDADGRSFRYVISAVMACRRALFEELGGFDERFVGYGGEDWDIAYRAWNAGAVLVHEPSAVAWHDGAEWAERSDDRSTADLQAMRLAALVPEPSTRGVALPGVLPDVIAEVDGRVGAADLVRCVHSVLRQGFRDVRVALPAGAPEAVAELYGPHVQRLPWTPDQRARARARLVMSSPLPAEALGEAMEVLVAEDLGAVEITCGGRPAATVTSARALGRAGRWPELDTVDTIAALFGRRRLEVGVPPPGRRDLGGFFSLG